MLYIYHFTLKTSNICLSATQNLHGEMNLNIGCKMLLPSPPQTEYNFFIWAPRKVFAWKKKETNISLVKCGNKNMEEFFFIKIVP